MANLMSADWVGISQRLNHLMRKKNWKRADIHRETEIANSRIKKLFDGSDDATMKLDEAYRLSEVLESTPEYILFGVTKIDDRRAEIASAIPTEDEIAFLDFKNFDLDKVWRHLNPTDKEILSGVAVVLAGNHKSGFVDMMMQAALEPIDDDLCDLLNQD